MRLQLVLASLTISPSLTLYSNLSLASTKYENGAEAIKYSHYHSHIWHVWRLELSQKRFSTLKFSEILVPVHFWRSENQGLRFAPKQFCIVISISTLDLSHCLVKMMFWWALETRSCAYTGQELHAICWCLFLQFQIFSALEELIFRRQRRTNNRTLVHCANYGCLFWGH